jgi:type II secretory pathway pseudopilin PulG
MYNNNTGHIIIESYDMFKLGSQQSGRSMVEMLGVLAIIGVLSVAGIAGYSKAMAKHKQTKLLEQMSLLVANTRAAYANQPNYAGLTNSVAINLSLVDDNMKVITSSGTFDPNQIKNSYGGDVTINTYGTTPTKFFITITNIPAEACGMLITTAWGYNDNNPLEIYTINNTITSDFSLIASNCKNGGSTNTIKMQHH